MQRAKFKAFAHGLVDLGAVTPFVRRRRHHGFMDLLSKSDLISAPGGHITSPSPSALAAVTLIPGLLEQLSAHEISRSAAPCRTGAGRAEAYERALVVSPPFLRALAVSPPSFSPSPLPPHSPVGWRPVAP